MIVTDALMPELNGIDATRQMKSQGIESKVVVLTMHSDRTLAAEAFRAGAVGFVSKESVGEELIEAVQHVSQGRSYLTPLIAKDVIYTLLEAKSAQPGLKPELTQRQRDPPACCRRTDDEGNRQSSAHLGANGGKPTNTRPWKKCGCKQLRSWFGGPFDWVSSRSSESKRSEPDVCRTISPVSVFFLSEPPTIPHVFGGSGESD